MRAALLLLPLCCAAPRLAAQSVPADSAAPNLAALPLTLRLYANTAYPFGQNDGAVWQGKGVTAALDLGFTARWRTVTLTVRPLLVYQQNAAFDLAPPPDTVPTGYSRFASPWHRNGAGLMIDQPQRFGDQAFWTLDPGQTTLAWRPGALSVSAGTENLWWGPARRNPLTLSNNAAGFPHLAFGTSRPIGIGVGAVEFQWLWGRLTESDWFDTVATNQQRYITGLMGTFHPRPFPGLSLGGARLFYQYYPGGGLDLGDYFLVLGGITKSSVATPSNPSGDDVRDQLLTLFARWSVPTDSGGFEAYVEWGRNDHSVHTRDLLVEPEHSQAYVLGFQHARRIGGGRTLRLRGELTHLERPASRTMRETPSWYVHHIVRQGLTQRGQVVGAGIGPGGNSQTLDLDRLGARGYVGVGLLRQVRDNDAFYDLKSVPRIDSVTGVPAFNRHDVLTGLAVRGGREFARWAVAGELTWLLERNRYYVFENDVGNINLVLELRRRF